MIEKSVTVPSLGELFRQGAAFVLTSHVNPDGDALGSELALSAFLRGMGKRVTVINHSPTPEYYRWLDRRNEILVYDREPHHALIAEADTIIVVDTNQPDRLRSLEEDVLAARARKIVIDHHLDPHPFADYYFIDHDSASTGEILHRLFTALKPGSLTAEIARALYTAIMTDTGSFRFPRTTAETFRTMAYLVEAGADPVEIYANIYETWSPGRMRLLGETLDSMRTHYDGKLASIVCTRETFRRTGTTEADADNFTVYPMSVAGVVIGIFFCELEDGVKISFRSKGAIPINELAKEFGGNGHLNAAGARLTGKPIETLMSDVIEQAAKYLMFATPGMSGSSGTP